MQGNHFKKPSSSVSNQDQIPSYFFLAALIFRVENLLYLGKNESIIPGNMIPSFHVVYPPPPLRG